MGRIQGKRGKWRKMSEDRKWEKEPKQKNRRNNEGILDEKEI